MATHCSFICNQCHYQCMVSGGEDALFSGPTVTCSCSHCNELLDVSLWNIDRFDDLESNEMQSESTQQPPKLKEEVDLTKAKCHECGEKGGLQIWDATNRPCPKCKTGTMDIDPNGMIIMSD